MKLSVLIPALILLTLTAARAHEYGAQAPLDFDSFDIMRAEISLTPEEKTWLDQKTEVRVRVGQWPPFMIPGDKPGGISIDYLRVISQRLGISFRFLPRIGHFAEDIENIKTLKGEYDVIPTMKRTPERASAINLTQDYLYLPWVIFTRKDSPVVSAVSDLRGLTVAVQDGYVMHTKLKAEYPELTLHVVNTTSEALLSLATGESDAFVGNLAVGTYLIEHLGLSNLKVAAPTGFQEHNQCMGVRRDWPELHSVLDKALAAFSPGDHARIRNRWLAVRFEYGISPRDVVLLTFGIALIILVPLLLFIRRSARLKREVEIQTKSGETQRERLSFIQSLLDDLPVGIAHFSLDTRQFTYCNPRFMEKLGWDPMEIGTDIRLLEKILPASSPHGELQSRILKDIESGERSRLHWENIPAHRPDGSILRVDIRLIPMAEQNIMACVVIDVDTQARAAERLQRALEKAENASRAKTEFLGNISHELRTPLNGVLGMLQLLRTSQLDKEQQGFVDTAIKSSRGLMTVMGDILNLSQIEAGAIELRNDPFEFRETIEALSRVFEPQAALRQLTLATDVDGSVPEWVQADEGRLRQVLFNLIGNALKFTHSGGVRLEVCALPYPHSRQMRILLFSISDSGIGIPHDRLGDILDSFTQADGSYTRRHSGAGLGLAIVRRLVPLMGGSLCIDSQPGEGTSVHLTTLVSIPEGEEVTAESIPADFTPPPMKLLLVEDDPTNADVIRLMLQKLEMHVIHASNGLQALELLKEYPGFDAVIMDIQMPEMDGIETTKRIRSDSTGGLNSNIPIIALTAHAMHADRRKCLEAGMDDYIAKPVEMHELAWVLRRVKHRS